MWQECRHYTHSSFTLLFLQAIIFLINQQVRCQVRTIQHKVNVKLSSLPIFQSGKWMALRCWWICIDSVKMVRQKTSHVNVQEMSSLGTGTRENCVPNSQDHLVAYAHMPEMLCIIFDDSTSHVAIYFYSALVFLLLSLSLNCCSTAYFYNTTWGCSLATLP